MICSCCDTAREFSAYRMFNPACLHCGARMIQRLGAMEISQPDCVRRRRAALAVWMEYGHSETELRRLAKGPPAIGPVAALVCEGRSATRRR